MAWHTFILLFNGLATGISHFKFQTWSNYLICAQFYKNMWAHTCQSHPILLFFSTSLKCLLESWEMCVSFDDTHCSCHWPTLFQGLVKPSLAHSHWLPSSQNDINNLTKCWLSSLALEYPKDWWLCLCVCASSSLGMYSSSFPALPRLFEKLLKYSEFISVLNSSKLKFLGKIWEFFSYFRSLYELGILFYHKSAFVLIK